MPAHEAVPGLTEVQGGEARPGGSMWLSCHIVCYAVDAYDRLLVDVVQPLVREFESERLIDGYFFIRYSGKAPHIRLRVLATSSEAEAACRGLLDARLAAAFIDWPRVDDSEHRFEWEDQTWHYVPYEPEVERYGGAVGVRIAERHFQDSSEAAFRILERCHKHTRPLGAKFALALEYVSVLGMLAECTVGGPAALFRDYMRHVSVPQGWEEALLEYQARSLPVVVGMARRQGEDLALYVGDDPRSPLAQWHDALHGTFPQLREDVQGWSAEPLDDTPWTYGYKYTLIVQAYLHMVLNRLGLWAWKELEVVRTLADAWEAAADGASPAVKTGSMNPR